MWFKKKEKNVEKPPYPTHIAIIMDGNGRWAKERKMPRTFGHKAGVEVAEKIIDYAIDIKLKYLTLYAFSTENWSRPEEEVKTLMVLFDKYAEKVLNRYYADNTGRYNNLYIRFIGDTSVLNDSIKEKIAKIEELNKERVPETIVNIAVNYGGRNEIVHAVNEYIAETGNLPITEEALSNHLYFKGQPDPDLVIRTGGELRISNFMLWEVAYSEIYSTPIYWPDFSPEELDKAVEVFNKRTRRYGGV